MKRSTMFLVGAAGVTLAAWGAERSLHRTRPEPKMPPECVAGPDGKLPDLPQCKVAAAQRAASSNSSSYHSRSSYFGGGWGNSYGDHSTSAAPAAGHGPAVSRGGFGSSSSAFTSSGS